MVLVSANDSCPSSVRIKLQLDAIAHKHLDTMQTHLAGEVRQYDRIVGEANTEERVGKRLFDGSFHERWFCHMVCVDKSNKNSPKSQIL